MDRPIPAMKDPCFQTVVQVRNHQLMQPVVRQAEVCRQPIIWTEPAPIYREMLSEVLEYSSAVDLRPFLPSAQRPHPFPDTVTAALPETLTAFAPTPPTRDLRPEVSTGPINAHHIHSCPLPLLPALGNAPHLLSRRAVPRSNQRHPEAYRRDSQLGCFSDLLLTWHEARGRIRGRTSRPHRRGFPWAVPFRPAGFSRLSHALIIRPGGEDGKPRCVRPGRPPARRAICGRMSAVLREAR